MRRSEDHIAMLEILQGDARKDLSRNEDGFSRGERHLSKGKKKKNVRRITGDSHLSSAVSNVNRHLLMYRRSPTISCGLQEHV